MYALQNKKSIVCFCLIILLTFVSCTGVILESNVHASAVVAGGYLTYKGLMVALGLISAGIVFTNPDGANEMINNAVNQIPNLDVGVSDADFREWQDWASDKFGKGGPYRPPNPKGLKNNLMRIGETVGASSFLSRLRNWLNGDYQDGEKPSQILYSGLSFRARWIPSSVQPQVLVFGNGYGVAGNDHVLVFGNEYSVKDIIVSKVVPRGDIFTDYGTHYQFMDITVGMTKNSGEYKEQTRAFKLVVGTSPTKPKPSPPKPNVPKPVAPYLPDGVTKTEVKKNDEAKVFPFIFPNSIPTHLPNPSWEDYGLETQLVPNPNYLPNPNPSHFPDGSPNPDYQPEFMPDGSPNPSYTPQVNPSHNPDGSPNPDYQPQQVPTPSKLPDQIGKVESMGMSSGVKVDDLIGVNHQGLDQWLQQNVTNITNNQYSDNPLDIDDPDFDDIDFDFNPLSDIGRALITRFPFCIPFDLVDSFKLMGGGEAEAPIFDLPIKSKNSTVNIKLDFNEFEKLAMLSRVSLTIIFIVALMFITSKTIKW